MSPNAAGPPSSPSSDQAFATPRVAAGLLCTDVAGGVLLLRPTYKKHRDIPGGYLCPGETPTEALRRELREELGDQAGPGSDLRIGPLLVADWAPSEREGDKLLWVFDGGVLGPERVAALCVDGVENDDLGFFDPGGFDELLIPRLARRLRAALAARGRDGAVYLEHGAPSGRIGH